MAKKDKESKMAAIAAAIAKCRDKNGRILPRLVVEEARDPASPLHDKFEWDVNKAAMGEWLRTASELIRSVRFIVEYEDRRIIAPFYVSDSSRDESSYIATTRAAKNHAMSERVLRDELSRIIGALRRAIVLSEVFGLQSSFQRMLHDAMEIERGLGVDDADGDDART